MSDLALRYAFAFVATQLVECPIYARGPLRGHRRPWIAAFVASLLTHPIAALLLPALLGQVLERPVWVPGVTALTTDFALRVAAFGLVSEGFAVLVEAAYLSALGVRRALAWSLLANGASAGLGAALTLTLGFP